MQPTKRTYQLLMKLNQKLLQSPNENKRHTRTQFIQSVKFIIERKFKIPFVLYKSDCDEFFLMEASSASLTNAYSSKGGVKRTYKYSNNENCQSSNNVQLKRNKQKQLSDIYSQNNYFHNKSNGNSLSSLERKYLII